MGLRSTPSSAWLVTGLIAGVVIGCGTGGGGGQNPATAYIARLDACGLLSEGELPNIDEADRDRDIACYIDCLVTLPCEDLEGLTCDPNYMPSQAVLDCIEECELGSSGAPFTCGDGSQIPADFVCDLEADCDDGSDELNCSSFSCADGTEMIPTSWVCDGGQDCEDGSDELGCPNTFQCASGGQTVPEEWKCDGGEDCEDGSDELGCPSYACANGEQVAAQARCNFQQDCEDGSDEVGCAQLVCPIMP